MGKIRINELARQLEVPSHEILEMLPELGVTEKKTHSSSVEDQVAEQIRRILAGEDGGGAREAAESNGSVAIAESPYEEEAPASRTSHDVAEAVSEGPVTLARTAPESVPEEPVATQTNHPAASGQNFKSAGTPEALHT